MTRLTFPASLLLGLFATMDSRTTWDRLPIIALIIACFTIAAALVAQSIPISQDAKK